MGLGRRIRDKCFEEHGISKEGLLTDEPECLAFPEVPFIAEEGRDGKIRYSARSLLVDND